MLSYAHCMYACMHVYVYMYVKLCQLSRRCTCTYKNCMCVDALQPHLTAYIESMLTYMYLLYMLYVYVQVYMYMYYICEVVRQLATVMWRCVHIHTSTYGIAYFIGMESSQFCITVLYTKLIYTHVCNAVDTEFDQYTYIRIIKILSITCTCLNHN